MTSEDIISDLKDRIAMLMKERDEFVQNASLQAAAMAGGIQELEAMLKHIEQPLMQGSE